MPERYHDLIEGAMVSAEVEEIKRGIERRRQRRWSFVEMEDGISAPEHPTIRNDIGKGEEGEDIEFIDELEGMNVGVP